MVSPQHHHLFLPLSSIISVVSKKIQTFSLAFILKLGLWHFSSAFQIDNGIKNSVAAAASGAVAASAITSQKFVKRTPPLYYYIARGTVKTSSSQRYDKNLCHPMSLSSLSPLSSSSSSGRNKPTKDSVGDDDGAEKQWNVSNPQHEKDADLQLDIWPLDEYNAALLNEVHPRSYQKSNEPHPQYDLVVIGAGAGGLVSSKQAARRGAKSAMISERLAGGDCLNVGCVPSKALLRCARAASQVRKSSQFGIRISGDVSVDFSFVMERMRRLRAKISPVDGHGATVATGVHVFQGRGRFTGRNTISVDGHLTLEFKKAVIATGGRPAIPNNIPGLNEAPYTTNEVLFNLEVLPPRMIVLGAGVVALEMAQTFAALGSDVTVIQRSPGLLFESKDGDEDAAATLQKCLEDDGVTFLKGVTVDKVTTDRRGKQGGFGREKILPLMTITLTTQDGNELALGCECLLIATGRLPNVENLGLDEAGIDYIGGKGNGGIVVDDFSCSTSHPDVYAVGDCVAGVPRLTHMSGEMAKVVVQNALFDDDWKLSNLVVPAVMYTHPEYATVGLSSVAAAVKAGVDVDVYSSSLEHNDRAILEGDDDYGLVKIFVKKGSDEIVGAVIVATRAGEMINEITLAMKHKIGLSGIGRNIHSYPTTGEAIMGCGLQFINARWKRLDDN